MEHNDVRHKLSEYIDGSISAEESSAVEEHLRTCAACSGALRELRKTIEHVRTIEEVEPPAWMTQKVMAQVRSAETERKSIFRRLFFPLSVKVPMQAVAVLFLAVGAFYIYRSVQPVYEPAEAPMKVYEDKKDIPSTSGRGNEQRMKKGASKSAERVPQTPGYKALDMKQEYEKPAPPVLADKMAPAPAKPEEKLLYEKKETAAEKHAASQTQAPVMGENRAAPAAGVSMTAEREPAAAVSGLMKTKAASEAQSDKIILTLNVQNVTDAVQKAEALLARTGGKIVKKDAAANATVLLITLNPVELQKFADQLRGLGTLKEKIKDTARFSEAVTIELSIVSTVSRSH